MISHIHRCIFVHIPKCGGTSIEDVIWPEPRNASDLWMGFVSKYKNKYQTGGLQHLLAKQIREEVGEKVFNEYFKFTIVRNPWDKAISQFFYMRQRPDLRDYIGMKEEDPFKEYLQLTAKKLHVQWEKQHKFFQDDNGKMIVDYVGRLERMEQDAANIFERIGIKAQIPHVNATRHHHYSEYYDDESREMVGEMYKEDIEILQYSFVKP